MKKRLPLLATGALCLGLGVTALPASAFAAPPASASAVATADQSTDAVTLQFGAYDAVHHTLAVHGTAEAFGRVTVFSTIAGTTLDGNRDSYDIDDDGAWSTVLEDVYRGDTVTARDPFSGAKQVATVIDAPTAPTATVSTTTKDGVVHATFHYVRHGLFDILDSDGKVVAHGVNSDPERDSFDFALPDPGRQATFTARSTYRQEVVAETSFTVNAGKGGAVPAAPTVESATTTVTLHGEARGVAKVTDAAGTTVAVRALGKSGTAQVTLAAASYRATQTAGGATSTATPFTVGR